MDPKNPADIMKLKIDTLQDILLKVYGVYTTVCDLTSFTLLQTSAACSQALQVLLYLDKDIRKTADGSPFDPEKQYFYANSLGLIWLLCVDESRAYLLGPAFTDNFSLLDILNKLESRNLSSQLKREMIDFLQSIPIIASHRMQQYGMMLHCCLRESAPTIDQFVLLNDLSHTPFDAKPAATIATNYALEQRLWKAVREGNLNYKAELDIVIANVTAGTISNGEYLRQDKNLAIIQVALACRAAMEGGLNPEIAYSLSDQYIQRIEACRNAAEVTEISGGVLDDYIRRVHQAKLRKGMSRQICQCCDYISMHPEDTPGIQAFAEKYGYTPYYFSKKFKQETGMSLRDYVIKEKIEHAKLLLSQGRGSISEISETLGFHSQSYFGSIFRKITGMTPSEYQLGNADSQEVTQ